MSWLAGLRKCSNLQVQRAILHGMTWDDLKVFLEVARQRSHAGAARVLRVDASTVGRRVVALERSLSSRLFDRTPEGLAPTESGAALLARAERIELEVLALQRELAGTDARQSGSVRLTASDGVVNYVIVPRLIELQPARHHDVCAVCRAQLSRARRRTAQPRWPRRAHFHRLRSRLGACPYVSLVARRRKRSNGHRSPLTEALTSVA
jgi:hypothetical protein